MRAKRPSKAEVERLVAGCIAGGLSLGGVRILPDGTLELLSKREDVELSSLEQWKKSREAR